MASCWSRTGQLLVALAMVAALTSYTAPTWIEEQSINGTVRHIGLWGECGVWKIKNCTFFWDNDFDWERNLPVYVKATQGLFSFGTATLIISFFLVTAHLACLCKDNKHIHLTVCKLLLLAFLEMSAALGVYGIKHYQSGARLTGSNTYDWGFGIGVCAAGLDLVAVLVFYLTAYCQCKV